MTHTSNHEGQEEHRSEAETAMARLINQGIAQAEDHSRPIDTVTARRIAACLHRGLGGELARFAGSGQLVHHQAARLELFYSTKDEPDFQPWRLALRRYITWHAGSHPDSPSTDSHPTDSPIDPPVEPVVRDPEAAVVYLRTGSDDRVSRCGLALQMQHQACRQFVRRKLHKRLGAVFADRPDSHQAGLQHLLAHLALCHTHRVVVHRLDRLPPGSPAASRIATLGASVLSVTDHHARTIRRQAELSRDLHHLNHSQDSRKETSR